MKQLASGECFERFRQRYLRADGVVTESMLLDC